MVVRCFYVNNSLFSTQAQWAVPFSTFVACNTCAAQVDCFTPYSAGLAAGVYPACSCNCAHRPSIASLNCLPTYYSTSMTQSATGGGVSSTNTASKTRSVGTRARSGSASTSPGLHSRSASASLTRRKSRSRRSASVSVSRTPQMRSLTGSGTQLHSATSSSSQSHTLGSFPQSLTRSLSKTRSVGTGQRSLTLSGSCVFPSASMSLSSSSTISLSKFKPKSWSKRFSLTPTGSISGDVYYSATSISATPEISASASTTTSRTAGTSHRSASDSKSRTKRSSVTLSLRSSTLSPASSTSRTTPGKGRIRLRSSSKSRHEYSSTATKMDTTPSMSSMMTLSRAPPGWGESRRHCQCKQHARSMSCCLRTLMALKPQAPLFHQPRLTRGGFQRRDAHPLPCRRCRLVSLGLSLLVARRRTVRDRQQCSWSCRTDSGLETGQAQ